jgi:hypothetical protein
MGEGSYEDFCIYQNCICGGIAKSEGKALLQGSVFALSVRRNAAYSLHTPQPDATGTVRIGSLFLLYIENYNSIIRFCLDMYYLLISIYIFKLKLLIIA